MGTRGSRLALAQAQWVIDRLGQVDGATPFELVAIKTAGDATAGAPNLGDGIFVKEIQRALLEGEVDASVHSLKDVPTDPVKGLNIAAIPERADPRECLVGATLDSLKDGAVVGTGSPRRMGQLRRLRPDLDVVPIRGNVPSRIEKVKRGEFDAVLLAAAGLQRLEMSPDYVFDIETMLPAPGQGALAIEVREKDIALAALVGNLHHEKTRVEVLAERAVLRELGGGCLLPVGCFGSSSNGELLLTASVTSSDGKAHIKHSLSGPADLPAGVAKRLARTLIKSGALDLVDGFDL